MYVCAGTGAAVPDTKDTTARTQVGQYQVTVATRSITVEASHVKVSCVRQPLTHRWILGARSQMDNLK